MQCTTTAATTATQYWYVLPCSSFELEIIRNLSHNNNCLGAGRPGFQFSAGAGISIFATTSKAALPAMMPLIQKFPGVKRPGAWSSPFTSLQYRVYGVIPSLPHPLSMVSVWSGQLYLWQRRSAPVFQVADCKVSLKMRPGCLLYWDRRVLFLY